MPMRKMYLTLISKKDDDEVKQYEFQYLQNQTKRKKTEHFCLCVI